MALVYDYECERGHVTEQFVTAAERDRPIPCPRCGAPSVRRPATPRVKLEGITGAFPTAYDRWERVREEKMREERKREAA